MLSDKIGARVAHYHTVLMTAVTIGLGVIVKYAREAETRTASASSRPSWSAS